MEQSLPKHHPREIPAEILLLDKQEREREAVWPILLYCFASLRTELAFSSINQTKSAPARAEEVIRRRILCLGLQLQKERASETLRARTTHTALLEQGMLSSASFCHCFRRFERARCSCCCFTANFNLCKLFSRPNGCVWGRGAPSLNLPRHGTRCMHIHCCSRLCLFAHSSCAPYNLHLQSCQEFG